MYHYINQIFQPIYFTIETCARIYQFDTLLGACEREGVQTSILVLDEKIC